MKKQQRQFIIICVILILGIAAYFGARSYNKNQEEKELAEEEASVIRIASIDSTDVTEFTYSLDGTNLNFFKDGDDWKYQGDESIDIDESGITTMLSALSDLTAADQIEEGEYESLEDYGLEEPSGTITVTTEQETIVFQMGDYNELLKQYYLKIEGDPRIFLMESNLSNSFQKTVEDLTVEEEAAESTEEETTTGLSE